MKSMKPLLRSIRCAAAIAACALLAAVAQAEHKSVTVGFIYVGPKDDYGYNQAHAEGCAGVQKLTWIKAVEEASVPETTAVQETMRNMIVQDGAPVLFP